MMAPRVQVDRVVLDFLEQQKICKAWSGQFTHKDDPVNQIFPPQTTLRYNVLPHPEDDPFAVTVDTIPEMCVGVKAHKEFEIVMNVSYTGKRPASNMAIINVKMVSGFVPYMPSLKKLKKQAPIQQVEVTATNVMLYLEKVTNVTIPISFTVERSFDIQNQRPAFVHMYDYYEDESTVVPYSAPCSKAKFGNA